ncbi:MAG: class I SAM-dependent RNA methyltransferase [Acidobacteriota bacterium]|nr:MAG: class I SAM-dependent RNA methyltransferase [Acidobacteriota bacterium]
MSDALKKNPEIGGLVDRVTLSIDRIVPGGLGIGFADGMTFFVPLTAPGDVIVAEVTRRKGKIAWCEIEELIESGPQRIEPPCPHYGLCGGCNFQHLTYSEQIAAKREIVRDCLRRIGGIEMPDLAIVFESPKQFGYRTRVRWHTDGDRDAVGFKRRRSDDVIIVDNCPILSDGLNLVLAKSDVLGNDLPDELEASADDQGKVVFSPNIQGSDSELSRIVAGLEYRYSAECFFQANSAMLEPLVTAAVEGLAGERALDLYCGVGLFSLPLAQKFDSVDAVEGSSPSAEYAIANSKRAGLTNVNVQTSDVELFCTDGVLGKYDAVVLDPPRSGPPQALIANLATSGVRTVSYVSCEPSILARDLKTLLAAGYKITGFTMLDLFPQTHHVETVVRLVQ